MLLGKIEPVEPVPVDEAIAVSEQNRLPLIMVWNLAVWKCRLHYHDPRAMAVPVSSPNNAGFLTFYVDLQEMNLLSFRDMLPPEVLQGRNRNSQF